MAKVEQAPVAWKPALDSYRTEEKRGVLFETDDDAHRAIALFHGSGPLFHCPRHFSLYIERGMVVPQEAIPLLQAAGLKFSHEPLD